MSLRTPAVLAAALLLAACGRSAAPPRTVPEADSLDEGLRRSYLRALGRVAEGDGPGADRALAPLLALRPPHVPSHLLHQDLLRAAGDEAALAQEYIALSGSLPGNASADVLHTRAVPALPEARVAAYQAAAVKDPAAPWPRIALATARGDLARDLLRKADAKSRAGFVEEGARLRADARTSLDRARTEGGKAVEVAPGLAAAHAALGHVLALTANLLPLEDGEKRDLRARAIQRLGMALALDPGDPWILAGRGMVLQEAGRATEAQADFDAACAASPLDPVLLAARARNLEEMGVRDRAADAWGEAARAAPGNPEVLVDHASALARAGRWKEALAEYRRADGLYASRGGERWKARRGLVTALAQTGLDARRADHLAEARDQLRRYREEGGPDAPWAERMAVVLGEEEPAEGAGAEPSKGPGKGPR